MDKYTYYVPITCANILQVIMYYMKSINNVAKSPIFINVIGYNLWIFKL